MTRTNHNNDTNDIEDLHQAALHCQSTTYTDPHTGFLVFTELAHLQRGTCCGNQCRHCPYGWSNVVAVGRMNSSNNNNNSEPQPPRQAKVQSGDKIAIRAELQRIKEMAQQQQQQQESKPLASTDAATAKNNNNNNKDKKKTGGRHGGRFTHKNVPYTRGGDKGTSQLLTGERRSKADHAFEAMGTVDELCSTVGVVHAQLVRGREDNNKNNNNNNNNSNASKSKSNAQQSQIDVCDQLLEIMSRLFDIGSHVAKPSKHVVANDDNKQEEDESSHDADSFDNSDTTTTDDDDDNSNNHRQPSKSRFIADGIGGGFDPQHVQELEDWIDQITEELPELNSFLLPTGSLAAAQLHVARCVCRRAERRMVPLVQAGVCDPTALQYVNRLSDYLFSAARWVNLVEAPQYGEIQYRRPYRGSKQRTRVVTTVNNNKEEDEE